MLFLEKQAMIEKARRQVRTEESRKLFWVSMRHYYLMWMTHY